MIADELERIADHISETLYAHNDVIAKSYKADQKIRHDDYDRLRAIAKELRGEDGQIAHDLGRQTVPWGDA